jgi:orotidine-5'-phosphate decarboxylase
MAPRTASLTPKERLIVALDVSDVEAARALTKRLCGAVHIFKVGYSLAYSGGLTLTRELSDAGHRVFLDLKLLDIPNTVAEGTAAVARLGAAFLTVHAYPQTLRAAVEGRAGSALKILGVTALTSMSDADFADAGYGQSVENLVRMRAKSAHAIGADGVIVSAYEAPLVRQAAGRDFLIVTPGIRPAGAAPGDQKRVTTPSEAIRLGADYLVVGRPITQARDPRAAAEAILAEMAAA